MPDCVGVRVGRVSHRTNSANSMKHFHPVHEAVSHISV